MTSALLAALIVGFMLSLMLLRIHIGIAMIIGGSVGYAFLAGFDSLLNIFNNKLYYLFSSYSLSVVPLFILMGQLATNAGLSRALFVVAHRLFRGYRGGLAMSAIGACGMFGAICGSSLATVSTMGKVVLPEMKRLHYADRLATGVLAAGGTLGILIPPSVVLIIYAILAEQNIAKMFMAAMVPGILAMLSYLIAIAVYVKVNPSVVPDNNTVKDMEPSTEKGDYDDTSSWQALPALLLFIMVIGGIYLGVFTPNEAASFGVVGAGLVAMNNKISADKLLECCTGTALTTGMIYLILVGAEIFNSFIGVSQLPQTIAETISVYDLSPYAILGMILVLYFVLGCFMDSLSMILVTIPIFFPIIVSLDFGLSLEDTGIWFGIITLVVVEVGLITPPIGLNVYIINTMAGEDVPMGETFRGVLPFLIADFLRIGLLLVFPTLTLGLVHWLM